MKKIILSLFISFTTLFSFSNAYLFERDNITNIEGSPTIDGWQEAGVLNKFSDSQVCMSYYFYDDGGFCKGTVQAKVGNLSFSSKSNQWSSVQCSPVSNVFFNGVSSQVVSVSSRPGCSYKIKLTQKSLFDGLTANGVSDLSPVITGLTNSVNEFIPYVVYVGLGVLGVLIGFYAIRWFINWCKNSVLSPFKK